MGKSVLLVDERQQQQQQQSQQLGNKSFLNTSAYNSNQQSDDAVINMDLVQKQQLQKNLIINQEVVCFKFEW